MVAATGERAVFRREFPAFKSFISAYISEQAIPVEAKSATLADFADVFKECRNGLQEVPFGVLSYQGHRYLLISMFHVQ